MTPWVRALNEAAPDLARRLPPTDTRLRADIRALELGRYDEASPCDLLVRATNPCLAQIGSPLLSMLFHDPEAPTIACYPVSAVSCMHAIKARVKRG